MPNVLVAFARLTVPLFAVLLPAALPLRAQTPVRIDWSAEDSARVVFLKANGQMHRASAIIVWAPVDSLDARWLAAFTDSLNGAISVLKSLIGGPYPWQQIGTRPIQFYFSPGRFVSHADGRDGVFISVSRVRQGVAPYIHEAAHELLSPPPPFYPMDHADSATSERVAAAFPYWLIEGLPDYLAQTVASRTGFPEGDIFAIGGLDMADRTCAARLAASNRRDEIRARVGRSGRLEALFTTERAEVAPIFYACSQAYTKFLAERVGVEVLVRSLPDIPKGTWMTTIERAAAASMEDLRAQWLAGLK